jgi:ankyrin repeat protein
MPTNSEETPRNLPEQPNLRHLKDQAKDMLKAGEAATLTEAHFKIARQYGFASWPKLKAHVNSLAEIGQLKLAIDAEDVAAVKAMMKRNPGLHRAPLGYGENGPLTWVAECRVPWRPPSLARLEMARWMIENGSDVHQGGDGPLMRAALNAMRVPMMELLLTYGADVNAEWNGNFPILFAACEAVNAASLKWLLEHGANPNCGNAYGCVTALDYLICGYARSPQLPACIDLILAAGGKTKYEAPGILDILRGDTDRLSKQIDADPDMVNRRFPELDCGQTGNRLLLLRGATLLHVAAEYGNFEAVSLLLDRGAQVDAKAMADENGIGGQTPIFHAATQFNDYGFPVAKLLVERGADLSIRVKLPGAYERPGEVVECTPLGYALRFPGDEGKTVTLLRDRGGVE